MCSLITCPTTQGRPNRVSPARYSSSSSPHTSASSRSRSSVARTCSSVARPST
ncbi:Uncharacterised protein [Mycobacteroides abscessus subsp. abscessus]|nr:Uncharacterised protein [Mycobacteroides abscessus subsp. abscessus]